MIHLNGAAYRHPYFVDFTAACLDIQVHAPAVGGLVSLVSPPWPHVN